MFICCALVMSWRDSVGQVEKKKYTCTKTFEHLFQETGNQQKMVRCPNRARFQNCGKTGRHARGKIRFGGAGKRNLN